jgi:thiol-disulfide isomerase/thioredoxin
MHRQVNFILCHSAILAEKGSCQALLRSNTYGMRIFGAVWAVWCATTAFALQVGDTREAVIAEMGEPQSKMSVGKREILNFATGRVEITNGTVSEYRGKFAKPTAPVADETSAPVAPAAPLAQIAAAEPGPQQLHRASRQRTAKWYTDIAEAQAAATKENKRILALFTGTDWCGPCQQFKAEVENDEQFAGIFSGSFIFFKNDWLRNTSQPEAVKEEVGRVKRKYRISAYPTLKVLDAEGEVLDTVEWTKVRGGSFKEAMIEAIDISRKATKDGNKASGSWWPF